ncbi:hypothetical protein B0T18DRAFT_209460 [Schizothecium vesticola]|uniref:Uncharacterized protein n=1 Tax=Schizothecium vesticola TaxID=314040 RepID=A0AA40EJF3_9PEZI|nr:hypothetical protein B0T18DRAFT_209460 [Schizothecium vesticola]
MVRFFPCRPLQIGGLSNRAGCLQCLALAEVRPPACRTALSSLPRLEFSLSPFSQDTHCQNNPRPLLAGQLTALSLLLKPLKASIATQPQEVSSSAGETSKIIHTTATDEDKIPGETLDPKQSPVEAHQASPPASRAEAQPDLLSVNEEESETISSVAQAEIPTPQRPGSAMSGPMRKRTQRHQSRSAL